MRTLDNFLGIEPFTVPVDDSAQLRELVQQARELRSLPFPEKLAAVKYLALGAMENAYEGMVVWSATANRLRIPAPGARFDRTAYLEAKAQADRFTDIVNKGHPLGYALEQKAGCCRYQGALFFVLGYEADLGDKHFLQTAPVKPGLFTVFNELIADGDSRIVSIFTESLKDKAHDYSRQNPLVFEQAVPAFPGLNMYSYHRTRSGLVIVENPTTHVKELKE